MSCSTLDLVFRFKTSDAAWNLLFCSASIKHDFRAHFFLFKDLFRSSFCSFFVSAVFFGFQRKLLQWHSCRFVGIFRVCVFVWVCAFGRLAAWPPIFEQFSTYIYHCHWFGPLFLRNIFSSHKCITSNDAFFSLSHFIAQC